ncbi:MAG: UDP-N-acetylmuramoyl-tripeptide--D-alanyl-D-alanine ligase [Pseudomonadales bacterium]|nr:UDP-N-acetylmuramoyl-tripeptide--D-alanyl-D-alanine ligase [Pseudomonadales bacterium]
MTDLWSWQEIYAACGINHASAHLDAKPISGISIDTRSLEAGDLFIALAADPGPRFHAASVGNSNGHEFIPQALAKSAAGLMVTKPVTASCPSIEVADSLDGLWQLGHYSRRRNAGKIVAITGSSGKTTARLWLEKILMQQAGTHASLGSLNNHWGVPLSLARMPRDSDYGIFEIGTSRAGEIKPLAELVAPHVALLLNVLPAHIGGFGNIEAIRREKLSISDGLEADGVLIVPHGLDQSGSAATRVLTFGLTSAADIYGRAVSGPEGMEVEANVCGVTVNYRLNAGGEHRLLTSLAVLAMVYSLDADLAQAAASFGALDVPVGRGNEITVAGIKIIDDSYNANPVSTRYALASLQTTISSGRCFALLGEMLELGDASNELHKSVAGLANILDGFITVGKGYSKSPGNFGHWASVEKIDLNDLTTMLMPGDTLLVKGSNRIFWQNKFVERLVDQLRNNSN